MEIYEAKAFVDVCYDAGRPREQTIELISALPLNGESSEVFQYVDTKYNSTNIDSLKYNFTDKENAEYFTAIYNQKLRYDHRRSKWLEWRGHYWRTDDDGQITRLAIKAVDSRYCNVSEIESLDDRGKAASKAISSQQRARLSAMVAIAQDLKPIANNGDGWDSNPWLFGTANCVIDLRTGQPASSNPNDLISLISPVKYIPEATAPRWEQFQNEIFAGNGELIHWSQKYLGYCITGDTREQIMPICFGSGANGKSVLLNAIEYVLGDYAYSAPFTMFELDSRSSIPNDLAALSGKRFVTARETTEGSRFNEGRVKALTGGDPLTARFLHCEFFTFKPVAKYMLAVNSRPRVHDQSFGFWRRVRLIPFEQRFEGISDDKNLINTLKEEASGILNWLIAGCLLYQKEGLEPTPECITVATREYETDSDPLIDFISSELIEKIGTRSSCSEIYGLYKSFCHNQGMGEKEVLTLTAFGRKMSQKFKKIKVGGLKYYVDLIAKSGQLQDSFIPNDTKVNVFQKMLYAREDNMENCHELSNCPDNTPENTSNFSEKSDEILELPED